MEQIFTNIYVCPHDNTMWEDVWTCMCNDRCPCCNSEIEPYESIEHDSGEVINHVKP